MSSDKYIEMSNKIRSMLIDEALKGNSHLASGLGIVELMIALFEVFDFEKDKFIFDIGHQRVPFILLQEYMKTGRFCYPVTEEKYNMFSYAGFAGLSASSAMGYAINNPSRKAIAFIGDGAITSGEVYEALNHIGEMQNNVLVILNQNGMSISPNVGALSDGKTVKQFAEALKFEYLGLADGYDIDQLILTLKEIEQKKRPVLLHVSTVKGKGFEPAENDPRSFHSVFYAYDKHKHRFTPDEMSWKDVFIKGMDAFERKCLSYLEKYDNMYITTPANPPLNQIRAKHMNRLIDTGINEQHCMTLSTTLASLGKKVILTMFGCFLSRCYSQIYDLCAQKAPLTVVLNMPGVTAYGATHQAVYDLNLLRMTPNATIMHPANIAEYEAMLDFAFKAEYPVFLQAPKNDIFIEHSDNLAIEYGKGKVLKSGDKITILPIGSMFEYAYELSKNYAEIEIINPRFLKPFDYELLTTSIDKTGKLLILEDGLQKGGVGEEILSYLVLNGIYCEAKYIACRDIVPTYTRTDYALHNEEYGLTMDACVQAVEELLK